MRRSLRGMWLVARTSFLADPARALGALSITIVESGTVVLFPYWLKLITDGAVKRNVHLVLIAAAGYGITLAVLGLTNRARNAWMAILVERTGHYIDRQLIELSMKIPTLAHHERADWANEMELLRQEHWRLGGSVWALVGNLQVFIRVGGSIALLAGIDSWLFLLPLFGIPMMIAGHVTTGIHEKAREATVERTRTAHHLFELATKAEPAKELRIFGLSDELIGYHSSLRRSFDRDSRKASLKASFIWVGAWLFFALGYVAALVIVAVGAVRDPSRITIGDVLMAFTIAGQLSGQLGNLAGSVVWLRQVLKSVGRLLWLIDIEKETRAAAGTIEVPDKIEQGIELRGVTFRYPGTEEDVLQDVNLSIPAGATVALVGENGAGKTTLIKLLCRFYDPTTGTITVDGLDMQQFDVEEWRTRTAGGFQDFVRFELFAKETVGLGDLLKLDEIGAIEAALVRAHAHDVPPGLPHGLETQLGRTFEDGVELSQGQWQKLALGRAMMREAPLLLMLDEPTASLDAETEHALFERYTDAARRVANTNGAITVLVSHRFSTVRMADLIVVVDGGKVVEHGSHEALMAEPALYAELYEIQARAYR